MCVTGSFTVPRGAATVAAIQLIVALAGPALAMATHNTDIVEPQTMRRGNTNARVRARRINNHGSGSGSGSGTPVGPLEFSETANALCNAAYQLGYPIVVGDGNFGDINYGYHHFRGEMTAAECAAASEASGIFAWYTVNEALVNLTVVKECWHVTRPFHSTIDTVNDDDYYGGIAVGEHWVTCPTEGACNNCTCVSQDGGASVSLNQPYNFTGCTDLTTVYLFLDDGDYDGDFNISDSAFAFSGLTSVTIPDFVTMIGEMAFGYCYNLTSVSFGASPRLTHIGAGAFRSIATWSGGMSLASITIPNSVTMIGDVAFRFTPLTSITIPNLVTTIGYGAFMNCHSLATVTIGGNVDRIGGYAFKNTDITSIMIPDSVTMIGDYAFGYCDDLTSVSFGASPRLTHIGVGAFQRTAMTSITIPNSVTMIGDATFKETPLTSVVIPDSVTMIGDYAFGYCDDLASVSFGASPQLTRIGMGAFVQSTIASITIPNLVTMIGDYAFHGCVSLTSVLIRNAVTMIGTGAFERTALTSVVIPSSVTLIGPRAFAHVATLTTVDISGSPTVHHSAFTSCTALKNARLNGMTYGPHAIDDQCEKTHVHNESSHNKSHHASDDDYYNYDDNDRYDVADDEVDDYWQNYIGAIRGIPPAGYCDPFFNTACPSSLFAAYTTMCDCDPADSSCFSPSDSDLSDMTIVGIVLGSVGALVAMVVLGMWAAKGSKITMWAKGSNIAARFSL
jgi:hypothetical protein